MNPDIEDEEEPPMLVDVETLPPPPASIEKQPMSPSDAIVSRVPITIVTGNRSHSLRTITLLTLS